ncbi:DNA adenine methylase [Sphingosinicella sp. BN140058]|uniref:DNA adenine methylase n=1 Tax=Sphingosinicella sp. BN140058 TaxID=1892855 RepID=UPI0010131D11|nr:DNA adenine methylase [Sphingosinicella sp. BN140058]QAY78685.1 DNA methyltransferase [Sphingosinicella sp. BN140058]
MAYRYLGNKARIADWIGSIVAERLPPGTSIADPMCGTATMSATFAEHGLRVIASDELRFPTLHARARLLHDGTAFGSRLEYGRAIEVLNALAPERGFFWREYSDEGKPQNGCKPRMYFTGHNAARIDAIRRKLREWRESGVADDDIDLLLHDLILAVNRVANIAGTYGYYRSSWNPASLAPLWIAPSEPSRYRYKHEVMQGRVEDLSARTEAAAVYLDPPYTKRQYGGNYHILETIAQEDEPDPVGDGGLRDWYPQASDFCYRRRAKAAFETTMSNVKSDWVFISYSEDGHISGTELMSLLEKYGSVKRLHTPIERFRSNARVAKSGAVHEHLYIVETSSNARTDGDRRTLVAKAQSKRSVQHRTINC